VFYLEIIWEMAIGAVRRLRRRRRTARDKQRSLLGIVRICTLRRRRRQRPRFGC